MLTPKQDANPRHIQFFSQGRTTFAGKYHELASFGSLPDDDANTKRAGMAGVIFARAHSKNQWTRDNATLPFKARKKSAFEEPET